MEEIRPGDTIETNTGVLKYNILRRESNESIQHWKSYPGIGNIVDMARKVTEEGDTSNIGKLAEMSRYMKASNLLQLLQRLQYWLVANWMTTLMYYSERQLVT